MAQLVKSFPLHLRILGFMVDLNCCAVHIQVPLYYYFYYLRSYLLCHKLTQCFRNPGDVPTAKDLQSKREKSGGVWPCGCQRSLAAVPWGRWQRMLVRPVVGSHVGKSWRDLGDESGHLGARQRLAPGTERCQMEHATGVWLRWSGNVCGQGRM